MVIRSRVQCPYLLVAVGTIGGSYFISFINCTAEVGRRAGTGGVCKGEEFILVAIVEEDGNLVAGTP